MIWCLTFTTHACLGNTLCMHPQLGILTSLHKRGTSFEEEISGGLSFSINPLAPDRSRYLEAVALPSVASSEVGAVPRTQPDNVGGPPES